MANELLGNLCHLQKYRKGPFCNLYSYKAGPEEPASGEAENTSTPPWLLQALLKPGPGGVSQSQVGDIHTSHGIIGNCEVEMAE